MSGRDRGSSRCGRAVSAKPHMQILVIGGTCGTGRERTREGPGVGNRLRIVGVTRTDVVAFLRSQRTDDRYLRATPGTAC